MYKSKLPEFKKVMKNATELKDGRNEQDGKLKYKFAALTDNDMLFYRGKDRRNAVENAD